MTDQPIPIKPTQKLAKSILDGLAKLPSSITSFAILNKTYLIADLKLQLQTYLSTFDAADQAHATAAAADEAAQAIAAEAVEFVAATKDALKTALGKKSTALESVGVKPQKPRAPLTPEQQMAKVAKAKATREARHTMGPKQKAAIKGQAPPGPTPPKPGP